MITRASTGNFFAFHPSQPCQNLHNKFIDSGLLDFIEHQNVWILAQLLGKTPRVSERNTARLPIIFSC